MFLTQILLEQELAWILLDRCRDLRSCLNLELLLVFLASLGKQTGYHADLVSTVGGTTATTTSSLICYNLSFLLVNLSGGQ